MSLTPARRRALEVVRDHPELGPSQFALLAWPSSKGHTTRSRRHATPAGGAVGAGIKMTAGAYLRQLERDGLVSSSGSRFASYQRRYRLSPQGRAALEEAAP